MWRAAAANHKRKLLIYKATFVYFFLATIAICAKKTACTLVVPSRTLINAIWYCTQWNVKDIVTLL